jgi:hypothetical protein
MTRNATVIIVSVALDEVTISPGARHIDAASVAEGGTTVYDTDFKRDFHPPPDGLAAPLLTTASVRCIFPDNEFRDAQLIHPVSVQPRSTEI